MLEIIGSVLGGLLGGGGSSSSQQSNQIDPRLAKYIYGENGKGGLLGDVQSLYRQQMGQGGMNDLMRGGLESQRQVLTSPQYTQGYDAMRSLGMGLLGAGVASNPFTSGGMGGQSSGVGPFAGRPVASMGQPQASNVTRPNTNMQYTPYQPQQNAALQATQTPIQSVAQYQQTTQNQAPAQQTIDEMIDQYMRDNRLGKYQFADSVGDGAGI